MIFLLITVLVFLIDLMIKKYMEQNLKEGSIKELFGGRIYLRKLHNQGVAFGVLKNHPEAAKTGTLGILGAVAAYFIYLLTRPGRTTEKTGIALILGGGLCNWFDRFHQGYVTDYFSFRVKWRALGRLVFNLSDMFIFLGSILTILGTLRKKTN